MSEIHVNDQKIEILRGLDGFVRNNLNLLAPPESLWMPSDYLPNTENEDWLANLKQFREAAIGLSDEVLVVLVGGMITEEALPSYAVSLNGIAVDNTGIAETPWAVWMRGWTAEEGRHGDLLNAYLRLTGRVNMRSVENTIYHLLRNGFGPEVSHDPYGGVIYTSFQERATKITHGNVGKLAAKEGDTFLGKICQRIAGDESRHETFYTRIMGGVMDADPAGGILSFRQMIGTGIAMPGKLMFDGKDPDLFDHFSTVAQRQGAYTVDDYAGIIQHLVDTWSVASRQVSGEAAKAQDWLCKQAERYLALAERVKKRLVAQPPVQFSWLHDRAV